jgi:hypothetical protein
MSRMQLCFDICTSYSKNPEKFKDGTGRVTLMERLLATDEEKDQSPVPLKHLAEEAFSVVGGATEEPANTVNFGVFYALHFPGVLEKLVKELDEAFTGTVEMPYAQLEKLPYLVSVGSHITLGDNHTDPPRWGLSRKCCGTRTRFQGASPGWYPKEA